MENINEINSYNSLTMSPSKKKEVRVSTSYRTTKRNIEDELNETLKKNEKNSYKRVSIEFNNNHPQKISVNIDKNCSNIQDISTKEEDSSSGTISKLPKIQKHLTSTSFNSIKDSNQLFNKLNNNNINNNLSNSNILNPKDSSILNNNNNNNSITNSNNTTYQNFYNSKNNNNYYYNRSHNINSARGIYSGHINHKNYNPLIPPADPLLKRTIVPKVNPRFGKMKAHITLPEFKGEEPITKFEYRPILKEMLATPSIEKQYEVSLYINSTKMLNNLIYLKTQLNKEGLISLENLVNVKKLNKSMKNETEEEDMQIIYDDQNNNNYENLNNENNKENNNNELEENSNKNIENGAPKEQNDANSNNNNQIIKNGGNKLQRPKTVYNELKPYYTLKNKNDNTLIFESRFESGNLLCAFRTEDENSYQLYLQNDTNTTGYIQWFFFRVSNTQKGRKVNFNIINMLRKTCIYNHGLKIMTYSTMAAAKENLGWHRDCYNSIYYINNLYVYNTNNDKKRNLHSLSFDYEFKYDNDTVYFANCLPYFYSTLMKELNHYELNEEKYPYFHRKTLTTTLGGNDLDMFTINSMYDIYKNGVTSVIMPKTNNFISIKNNYENNNNNSQIIDERKAVVLIGRQHPGETVGSYVIKGCIDFLMGNSDEAKKLREIYLFKIVPMMNPDGVLVGNSRTSFAGCDLNRRWGKPNEIIHPEVFHTKQMITKLATQRNIAFVIDCHGHFGTFNSLFYCNYKDNKRTCKLFPYICSRLSKIISFQQCTFSMPRYKLSTERISLFNELDDEDNDNIVALETSFFGINRNGEYSHIYFNSNLLKEIGRDICLGMLSYYYKCENISIEVNFFSNKENLKKLDVDMREFESEIIREVNEDDEEVELNDEKSESEPSVDNLDKNQIMKLMPGNGKRRRRRKNKIKKFDKKKDKNRDLDIELFNPLKEAARRLEEEKKKKNKSSTKIIINCNNDKNKKNNQIQPPLLTDPNMKNEYTQTEEIFFKMHWSYFTGQYKILTCKRRELMSNNNNNNNNYIGISQSLFGQLKNRNIYNNSLLNNRRQGDIINSNYNKFNGYINYNSNNNLNVVRSKSLSNRMIFSSKNVTPGAHYNKNNNINNNINNINKNHNNINNYYNKIINENTIKMNMINNINNNENKIDNINEKNNEENSKMNGQNNIKIIKNQNNISSNQKINMGKSQYSTFVSNKQQKKNLTNSYNKENSKNVFNKTSSSLMNPFQIKQKKIINHKFNNNNIINNKYYKIKNENENGITNNGNINNENNNKFFSTKYNGFNRNIINKDNIKNKMAKSSTSFYKP